MHGANMKIVTVGFIKIYMYINRDISLFQNVQPSSGAHTTPYPVDIGVILRAKRPECKINRSPSSIAETKNGWR